MRRFSSPTIPALVMVALVATAGFQAAFAQPAKPMPETPSAAPIDLSFPEPTSASAIYRSVGKAFGVHVLFDPKLRDLRIALELKDVSMATALATLDRATGYFTTAVDERTVMVAEDTPQNRRSYEKQVIRAFQIENIGLKDAMTIVRSLVGAKNIAASEDLNGLVVRDTAGKVAVMERLLEAVDQPQAEVTLDVDVLYLKSGQRERAAGEDRLSAEGLEKLRRSARSLMRQEISILENHTASWSLKDQVQIGAGLGEVGFELQVQPRVHAASDEVTLRLAFQLADGDPGAGALVSTRDLESATRIRTGETFLLSGLGVGTASKPGRSWLASRFDLPDGPGEVVLAVTPRIVRGSGFSTSDLAAICVGTETHVELCDPAELTRTAALGIGSATFRDTGGESEDERREAVRERLRQRLRDLEDAKETKSESEEEE